MHRVDQESQPVAHPLTRFAELAVVVVGEKVGLLPRRKRETVLAWSFRRGGSSNRNRPTVEQGVADGFLCLRRVG